MSESKNNIKQSKPKTGTDDTQYMNHLDFLILPWTIFTDFSNSASYGALRSHCNSGITQESEIGQLIVMALNMLCKNVGKIIMSHGGRPKIILRP